MTEDELGTHLDWRLEAVTPGMIDWFWANMEKGFVLWHPQEHEPLEWAIPPSDGTVVGSVHVAPQTWSDGRRQNLYIRCEDPAGVPDEIKSLVVYEHCVIVAGLGFGPESLTVAEPLGYRVHQWQRGGDGVVGRSSAIGRRKPETAEDGLVWARHATEEIGNWGVFLPDLYRLYRPVTNPVFNRPADLRVVGSGPTLRYTGRA